MSIGNQDWEDGWDKGYEDGWKDAVDRIIKILEKGNIGQIEKAIYRGEFRKSKEEEE